MVESCRPVSSDAVDRSTTTGISITNPADRMGLIHVYRCLNWDPKSRKPGSYLENVICRSSHLLSRFVRDGAAARASLCLCVSASESVRSPAPPRNEHKIKKRAPLQFSAQCGSAARTRACYRARAAREVFLKREIRYLVATTFIIPYGKHSYWNQTQHG